MQHCITTLDNCDICTMFWDLSQSSILYKNLIITQLTESLGRSKCNKNMPTSTTKTYHSTSRLVKLFKSKIGQSGFTVHGFMCQTICWSGAVTSWSLDWLPFLTLAFEFHSFDVDSHLKADVENLSNTSLTKKRVN